MNIIRLFAFSTLLILTHSTFAQTPGAKTSAVSKTPALVQSYDTLKTNSGLRYIILKQGNGQKPWPGKEISIYYSVDQLNGKHIDNNHDGKPYKVAFKSDEFIPGLVEGIALMTKGSKFRFIVPPNLAYGEKGKLNPDSPSKYLVDPHSTVIYEMELLDFKK